MFKASAWRAAGMLLAGGIAFSAGNPFAQEFPSRPVRLVSAPVGSGSDVVSRIVAQGLSGTIGQQVIVDNRNGDIIPGEIVSKAPPDGYTLNFTGGSFWLVPFLYSNVPWD